MGHTLAVMFEEVAGTLHQIIDPVSDRSFLLLSGIVIVAVGMRLRRALDYVNII